MKALVFNIRVNSLYSIRIPFTWQSALTYPILPPSAVIGMLANALQRHKNDKRPLDYLKLIDNENVLLWAGSRLLDPCVIKSYTTSAITKFEGPIGSSKFTNALARQYAYSKKLQIAAIFKSDTFINDIAEAVKTTPLTCGDSESPISLDSEVMIKDVKEIKVESIQTEFPIPFTKDTKIEDGNGLVYLMHKRCKKTGNSFPLISYMVPVREDQKILNPSYLKVSISNEKVFKIDGVGNVLSKSLAEEEKGKVLGKKRKSKKK